MTESSLKRKPLRRIGVRQSLGSGPRRVASRCSGVVGTPGLDCVSPRQKPGRTRSVTGPCWLHNRRVDRAQFAEAGHGPPPNPSTTLHGPRRAGYFSAPPNIVLQAMRFCKILTEQHLEQRKKRPIEPLASRPPTSSERQDPTRLRSPQNRYPRRAGPSNRPAPDPWRRTPLLRRTLLAVCPRPVGGYG